MKQIPELLPCPFCESKAFIDDDLMISDSKKISYRIVCDNDECSSCSGWHDDEQQAVTSWNKRAGNAGPLTDMFIKQCKTLEDQQIAMKNIYMNVVRMGDSVLKNGILANIRMVIPKEKIKWWDDLLE